MSEGEVRKSKNGKTIYLQVGVWYNEDHDRIHIAATKEFITTVNANPKSKRGHPNLFKKLARSLREHGVPAPEINES